MAGVIGESEWKRELENDEELSKVKELLEKGKNTKLIKYGVKW